MWIYFPVVLTWAVSWWWWLQCWKRIASLCTERRVQQNCTVHRVQKCLKNVQKLCSVYSCCTEYQNVQKECSKTEHSCCSVHSCWTQHLVKRDAMHFQHCNHHHLLKAQVKTTRKYIHTFGKFTRLFVYFYERKKKSPLLIIISR